MQGQSLPLNLGRRSDNREKFEKIGRNDRLLHPEDRKNSLWSDFSLIEIKKKLEKNSHWSDCYLLSILRNLVGKFEIHMILLSLYSIYLSTSLHLSEVSGIFDLFCLYLCRPEPFQVKMLRNLAYTKERKLSRWLPFTLERSAELSVIIHTMKKSIHNPCEK